MLETTTVSILFIEDEARTKNFFARKRFTCQCSVDVVESESAEWRTTMSLFKKKFGKVFAMILPLPDFTLFRLIPSGGLYVRGFGQAFEVSADMKNSKHVTNVRIDTKRTKWMPIALRNVRFQRKTDMMPMPFDVRL